MCCGIWRAAGPRRPESGQRPSRRGQKGLATEPGPLARRDSAPRPGAAPRLAGRRSPHTGCHSASERPGARPPRPQVRNLNRNQPSGSRVSHHALPCSSEAPRGRLSVSVPAPPRGRVCATRGSRGTNATWPFGEATARALWRGAEAPAVAVRRLRVRLRAGPRSPFGGLGAVVCFRVTS